MFWALSSLFCLFQQSMDQHQMSQRVKKKKRKKKALDFFFSLLPETTLCFISKAHTLVVTFFLAVMAHCIIGRALVLSLRHAGIFVALGAFWIFALTAVWLSSIAFGSAESWLFAV